MKALSIKQPWAWLICAGYKDVENRNWKIGRNPRHGAYSSYDVSNFSIKLPERIYVHAGKTVDSSTLDLIGMNAGYFKISVPDYARLCMVCESWAIGAIIGEVDIIDCVTESASPWFSGPYGFVLANPKLYDKPIPYKGQLGFFEVNLDQVKEK